MGEALIVRRGQTGSGEFIRCEMLLTENATFVVPCTGIYRICAIGKGAAGYAVTQSSTWYAGGCGGGGYVDLELTEGDSYTASFGSSDVSLTDASGANIIRATHATDRTAGTVSGAGVIAFSSNGTNTSSIIPPDVYNDSRYISEGGAGGTGINLSSDTERIAGNGGNGLFGGRGGDGGSCAGSLSVSVSYTGSEGKNGSGTGGDGDGRPYSGGSSTSVLIHPGGGGGGGYGGGGGTSYTHSYMSGSRKYVYGKGGKGGDACIFIERIG